jgi:hypothetical protein
MTQKQFKYVGQVANLPHFSDRLHFGQVGNLPHIAAMCAAATICLLLSGCGRGGIETAAVSGTVTCHGKPVTEGTVFFQPEKGPGASGVLDSQGRYVLRTKSRGDGAPLGKNAVAILPPTELAGPDSPTPGQLPKRAFSNIPEKCRRAETSRLVFHVKPGNNVFDIELKD